MRQQELTQEGEGGYFIAPPSKVIEGKFQENIVLKTIGVKTWYYSDGLMSVVSNKTTEYVKELYSSSTR